MKHYSACVVQIWKIFKKWFQFWQNDLALIYFSYPLTSFGFTQSTQTCTWTIPLTVPWNTGMSESWDNSSFSSGIKHRTITVSVCLPEELHLVLPKGPGLIFRQHAEVSSFHVNIHGLTERMRFTHCTYQDVSMHNIALRDHPTECCTLDQRLSWLSRSA